MEPTREYLAGDIHSLEKVNKTVPRMMALPLLFQSRIQIRRNEFGIKSRFFEHMKSYDYKFKSLAAEPRQVIRALRPRTPCVIKTSPPPSNVNRSLVEKSSSWKLPPNVYRIRDHFEEVSKRKMGKLGPYRCFTVERDAKTVRNHFAAKPDEEFSAIFYDHPTTMMDEILKSRNRNKARFLKAERFQRIRSENTPPPTKYYPQNFVLKSKVTEDSGRDKKPILYYPSTTVPVKEMDFQKEKFMKPGPEKYDPHDVTCKCYLAGNKRCPANVIGNGHHYVFDSKVFRLVAPTKIRKRRKTLIEEPELMTEDDMSVEYSPTHRVPISFRTRRSSSCCDLGDRPRREIRFNTIVKRKNLFSVKTGRPVGFLSAEPRFQEKSEIAINIEKQQRKMIMSKNYIDKPKPKPPTKERLEVLSMPKNPLPRICSQKLHIFEPLLPISVARKKLMTDATAAEESVIAAT